MATGDPPIWKTCTHCGASATGGYVLRHYLGCPYYIEIPIYYGNNIPVEPLAKHCKGVKV